MKQGGKKEQGYRLEVSCKVLSRAFTAMIKESTTSTSYREDKYASTYTTADAPELQAMPAFAARREVVPWVHGLVRESLRKRRRKIKFFNER